MLPLLFFHPYVPEVSARGYHRKLPQGGHSLILGVWTRQRIVHTNIKDWKGANNLHTWKNLNSNAKRKWPQHSYPGESHGDPKTIQQGKIICTDETSITGVKTGALDVKNP